MGEKRKRAYLVLGPESSGTRLMTRLLIAAGCHGSAEHFDQPFDAGVPEDGPPLVVWRRSVPHNREWPPIGSMVIELMAAGYQVHAVVMTRDWYCMARSQVRAGHVDWAGQAYANLRQAYPHIFGSLGRLGVGFTVISYESLVQRPEKVLAVLYQWLDLEPPAELPTIVDANAKWYIDVRPGTPGQG